MTSKTMDFITGSPWRPREKDASSLDLCYSYPSIEIDGKTDSVIVKKTRNPRDECNIIPSTDDGLFAGSAEPLTGVVVKPYRIDPPKASKAKQRSCSQLVEIAIRDVKIHPDRTSDSAIRISSVAVLYKGKVVCKASSPFNRQLYKLLLKESPESTNLSIQVQTQGGDSTMLPLPLPKRSVKNGQLEIDFSLAGQSGELYSGTVVCTFSLTIEGQRSQNTQTTCLYPTTNDPNDPRNGDSVLNSRRKKEKERVKYFLLDAPALRFTGSPEEASNRTSRRVEPRRKPPENVLFEQPTFSLGDLSFRDWFRTRHPLRPTSSTHSQKSRLGRKEFLLITVLRGVEVPVREESPTVQPLLEVEWGEHVHGTTPAEGPSPVWQQTFRFEMPQGSSEQSVMLRLYDQHPIWGLQWLGEARIPMEHHRSCQDLERWVGLSPLCSPVMSFGYVQANPGQAHTRIYILMKMEQPGNLKTDENGSVDHLSRTLQRCMVVPYKIDGIENSLDASRLAMLLPSLPLRYGPLTPKQALNLNKVDHYGRAALLATLLRGLDLQASLLLGTSQTRKLAAYVLTIDEGMGTQVWDPENGDHYKPMDNRCSLINVSRQISHQNIWENMQRTVSPANLRYDTKSSKDWRPIIGSIAPKNAPALQTLELRDVLKGQLEEDLAQQIEEHLKQKVAQWRSMECLTTIWNRHAATMLRGFIMKLKDSAEEQPNKKELRQLYRAYHTHGFVVNLRHSSLAELSDQLSSTKIHKTTGPIEFAIVCHVQQYIGNAHSLWLAVVVMRKKE